MSVFFYLGVYILGQELSQILRNLGFPLLTKAGDPSHYPRHHVSVVAPGESSIHDIKTQGQTNDGAGRLYGVYPNSLQ